MGLRLKTLFLDRWPRHWSYLLFAWVIAGFQCFNLVAILKSPWVPAWLWITLWVLWATSVTDVWRQRRKSDAAKN